MTVGKLAHRVPRVEADLDRDDHLDRDEGVFLEEAEPEVADAEVEAVLDQWLPPEVPETPPQRRGRHP